MDNDHQFVMKMSYENDIIDNNHFQIPADYTPKELLEKNIDYVLISSVLKNFPDSGESLKDKIRRKFLETLEPKVDFRSVETSCHCSGCRKNNELVDPDHHVTKYWLLTAKLESLKKQAELVKLELPLKDFRVQLSSESRFRCFSQKFESPEDAHTYNISMPFLQAREHLFLNTSNGTVFSNTRRIYLAYNMIREINLVHALSNLIPQSSEERLLLDNLLTTTSFCGCRKRKEAFVGIKKLLEFGIFEDGFALHDYSDSHPNLCNNKTENAIFPNNDHFEMDPVKALSLNWTCCKFQPLKGIRSYFGEKLTFYYAWFGFITFYFGILSVIGLGFFIYGTIDSAIATQKQLNGTFIYDFKFFVSRQFNNVMTVFFAVVVLIWGTVLSELWTRQQNTLSYRWDVNYYDKAENRRPEYVLSRSKESKQQDMDKGIKSTAPEEITTSARTTVRRTTFSIVFIVSCLVVIFAAVFSIQTFRSIMETFKCSKEDNTYSPGTCFFMATVLPIVMHSVFIFITDMIYLKLARWLTDKENHEYYSDFENSYAVKVFLCQFANNYSPLFYLAFIRQGTLPLNVYGIKVTDQCDLGIGFDCYSQLTLTTAGYMISKSLLKSFKDFFYPAIQNFIINNFFNCLRGCLLRCCSNCCCQKCQKCQYQLRYDRDYTQSKQEEMNMMRGSQSSSHHSTTSCCCFNSSKVADVQQGCQIKDCDCKDKLKVYLIKERIKGDWKSILIGEYVEKCILYGYMMLFGATFSLGPLVVFIVLIIDLRLDAHRLLFSYRRPIPYQSGGIGIWESIISFLHYTGIAVTGAILAITADSLQFFPGLSNDYASKLVFFVIFEHVMFTLKFVIKWFVNDVPHVVVRNQKWEYEYVPKLYAGIAKSADDTKFHDLREQNKWYSEFRLTCCSLTNQDVQASPEYA